MSKIIITQSNYIPWKGFFDAMHQVDKIVLYDDMQFTKRDWRNRNLIKTPNGLKWLTIPVEVKGKFHQKINETIISDKEWNLKHLNFLKENYKKAESYKEVIDWVEDLYKKCQFDLLSDVNQYFIEKINDYLEIKIEIFRSEKFILEEGKTERLVSICKDLKATEYFSGPAAKNYMDESVFVNESIKVNYFNYSGYKEYPQLYGDFEHGVSILDLIFNLGKKSIDYYAK
jgi:hypothetical protein